MVFRVQRSDWGPTALAYRRFFNGSNWDVEAIDIKTDVGRARLLALLPSDQVEALVEEMQKNVNEGLKKLAAQLGVIHQD